MYKESYVGGRAPIIVSGRGYVWTHARVIRNYCIEYICRDYTLKCQLHEIKQIYRIESIRPTLVTSMAPNSPSVMRTFGISSSRGRTRSIASATVSEEHTSEELAANKRH